MTPSLNGPDWGQAPIRNRASGCITTELTREPTSEPASKPTSELTNPHLAQPGANRVLLVEDNEINRQLMSDFLAYHGYQVEMVGSGKDFVPVFERFGPHVVLMDLRLPDGDGYDLLKQVQAHPVWQKVPVIIVSACALQRDQYRALALGARRYLVKPIRLSFLLEVLTAELQKSERLDGGPDGIRVA
jgi:DNA-binding response OmpR family regulator